VARRRLPSEIAQRGKKPYRAPIHRSFFHSRTPEYVGALLDEEALRRTGWFRPPVVRQLREKLARGKPIGESDEMALAGIISTQLLHEQFVDSFRRADPLPVGGGSRICRRSLFRSVVQ
jgi:asparagine synthase (glutamine-hydrolysing)